MFQIEVEVEVEVEAIYQESCCNTRGLRLGLSLANCDCNLMLILCRIKQERTDDEEQVDRKPQIVDNGYYDGGYN